MGRIDLAGVSAMAAVLLAQPAAAGETPLYQPSPAWIHPVSLPATLASDSAFAPLYDWQVRIADGRVWSYFDITVKMTNAETIASNSTLALPWLPDKGDLIVHEVAIIRNGATIDLLKDGKRFDVLRREQQLEQRQITGLLTATMEPEGLQIGDTLHVRASVTTLDKALGDRAQWQAPLIALPAKTSGATMALSFPSKRPPHWQIVGATPQTTTVTRDGFTTVSVALPTPKKPEMPGDAPLRFRQPAFIEASDFASWREVSKVMSPLFATEGKIEKDGALAAEIETIRKASADPLTQAALALRSVQDKIRYVAVQMNGGNYVPQAPERTWSIRYGDCKAKTLLLLAMLRALQIDAEPVLASATMDDLVPQHLPSAGAFDHVFVRARIGGRSVWLDGTDTGTRLPDLGDTPTMRQVLPLRADGAELEAIQRTAPARPTVDITLDIDESTSTDLPSLTQINAVFRGGAATLMNTAREQLVEKEHEQFLATMLQRLLGEGQFADLVAKPDPDLGTVAVSGKAVFTTPWTTEDHLRKRQVARLTGDQEFSPDRARTSWANIPVTTGTPDRMHYKARIHLPEDGRGLTVEGARHLDTEVAGRRLQRSLSLEGAVLTLDETMTMAGTEVAPAAVAGERNRAAAVNAQAPRLIAPLDTRRRWQLTDAATRASSQIAGINAVYERAIATAEADDTLPWSNRANYRKGIGDRKGAIADLSHVIATHPSVDEYLVRADIYDTIGDYASAEKDADAARAIDPSSVPAIGRLAYYAAKQGKVDSALALLDEKIALGGQTRFDYQLSRAQILGEFGDPAAAIGQYDALITQKPGKPSLLNGRCWTKALRQVQIDTALKDCTSAIELSDDSSEILDSRAVVWLRLGKFTEALADIDAALVQSPGLAQSRYIRSLILRHLDRGAEADSEREQALRILPMVEKEYRRYAL